MEDSEDEGEEEVIDPEEFDPSMMEVENNERNENDENKGANSDDNFTIDEQNVPSLSNNKNGNNDQPEDTALPTEDSPNPV
jgi:hypothetical protein